MGLWPASGFESRRGKMEPSTDQFLVDKFLKNQNIYSDLNTNCTYSLKGYNRLSLFQGVPWKSVIKPVLSCCFVFKLCRHFSSQKLFLVKTTRFFACEQIVFFATKFRNHEVEFFLAMRNLKPSFETNICSAGFPVYKSMETL